MQHLIRVGLCLLALLSTFIGWYLADPLLATFRGADPSNTHALNNLPLYRIIVYATYLASIGVTWITTKPRRRYRDSNNWYDPAAEWNDRS